MREARADASLQKSVLGKVGEIAIRLCGTDDIPAVIDINTRTLPEHYSEYFYHEILSEFPETFLVAELEGKVIGYIMCRIEYGFSQVKRLGLARKGHIVSVAVLEEHRRRGLGTKLMQVVQEEMTKKNASEAYLEVRVSNEEAVRLYQALGYKVTGRLEAYYRDGEPAFVMATQIPS
jgi:ribosomal-protein-alanine N-acetyltransferase